MAGTYNLNGYKMEKVPSRIPKEHSFKPNIINRA